MTTDEQLEDQNLPHINAEILPDNVALSEEINEYDLTNYWNDDYYEIKLGKNSILFFIPNTEKTNKENRECNIRIYDDDFIKFLNKFYVEYVN